MICSKCGRQLDETCVFCPYCGQKVGSADDPINPNEPRETHPDMNTSWLNNLNKYVGNDQPTELNWKMLFSDVTKKHSTEEAEQIFIYGTKSTTPRLSEVSKDWPHPWLYSRVFFVLFAAFFLLWICIDLFGGVLAVPGLFTIGSFMVPLTTLVLFMEVNVWRNISFFKMMSIFFIGGCASLVATLFLFSFFDVREMSFVSAAITGCVEELGKLTIIYLFMKRMKKVNILNGLLIGASIGAGFAAFESAGYAMFYSRGDFHEMMNIIFLRGFLTPGGHVTWAAITGAALAIAANSQNGIVSSSILKSTQFLRLFCIPIVLHAIWDSPIRIFGSNLPILQIALTVFVWIVVLILVNMGLNEVSKVKTQSMSNNKTK